MLLSAFGQRGMHLNAHLNSVHFAMLALAMLLTPSAISFSCALAAGMPLYGNGDIVLAMGETVLEQGERSKAIYKVQKLPKVKSCPRLPLRPQFR